MFCRKIRSPLVACISFLTAVFLVLACVSLLQLNFTPRWSKNDIYSQTSLTSNNVLQRKYRTNGGFAVEPEVCRTQNGSATIVLVVLRLKVDTLSNREIIRAKWSIVGRRCLYQILFWTWNDNESLKLPLETDIFRPSKQLIADDSIDAIQNVIMGVNVWIKRKCGKIKAIFVGAEITTKSVIIYLGDMIGHTLLPGEDVSISDEFLHCTADAVMSERQTHLYVMNKNHSDGHISVTREKEYRLMEPQEIIVNPDKTELIPLIKPLSCQTKLQLPSGQTIMIIITHSNANNFQLREKIRQTWANPPVLQRNRALNFFFVGLASNPFFQEKLNQERSLYEDIIQGNFPETYRHLTTKHRTALKFLTTYCRDLTYKFVLKTDDDMVVDLDSIITYMEELEAARKPSFTRTFFCAHLIEEDLVPRNKTYKWYITPKEFAGRTYPPYCYGNGYLMTRDLIDPLYNMSWYTKDFWVDDVYFSGFIARNLGGVEHAELPYQHPFYSKMSPPEVVLEKKKWFLHTWQDADMFDAYWYAFQSRRNLAIRNEFSAGVRQRTGAEVADEVFEGVSLQL